MLIVLASTCLDRVSFVATLQGYRDMPLKDAPMLEVLRRTSESVFVPLTVGGGIRDFTDRHGPGSHHVPSASVFIGYPSFVCCRLSSVRCPLSLCLCFGQWNRSDGAHARFSDYVRTPCSNGKHYGSLDVAAEYFRNGADKARSAKSSVCLPPTFPCPRLHTHMR